jgi:5-methylcytosine-specific restriction endonuclease McrA
MELRRAYLAQQPRCEHPGCTSGAEEVDHKQRIADRPDLRLTWSNLQSLCRRHHSQKTAREVNSRR